MTTQDLKKLTTRELSHLLTSIAFTLADRAIVTEQEGKTGSISLRKAAKKVATAVKATQFAASIPSISI